MELTHQLLNYTEKERLALITTIASIATLDKVGNDDELEFILALGEAAELDFRKMQSAIDVTKDPHNKNLSEALQIISNSNDLRYFFVMEILPFIKNNPEFKNTTKIESIIGEMGITPEQYNVLENTERHVEINEGSFLEKLLLSIFLRMKVSQQVMM